MSIFSNLGLAIFSMAFMIGQNVQAETLKYTGSGRYTANVLTMDLGNGDVVYGARNEGVITISTTPPTLLFGKCMGLGLITAKSVTSDVYCSFRSSDDSSLDFKATTNEQGGSGKIIGRNLRDVTITIREYAAEDNPDKTVIDEILTAVRRPPQQTKEHFLVPIIDVSVIVVVEYFAGIIRKDVFGHVVEPVPAPVERRKV